MDIKNSSAMVSTYSGDLYTLIYLCNSLLPFDFKLSDPMCADGYNSHMMGSQKKLLFLSPCSYGFVIFLSTTKTIATGHCLGTVLGRYLPQTYRILESRKTGGYT